MGAVGGPCDPCALQIVSNRDHMTSACKAITVQYVNIVAMSLEESRIYMLPTAGSIWFSIC